MAMQESWWSRSPTATAALRQARACNVHVAPGLGRRHGLAIQRELHRHADDPDAGQQEQGHGLMEPVLYGPLVQMAEPLVKWASR